MLRSDGSAPDKANCGPEEVCSSPEQQCPNGTEFWQLSRVDVPISKGVGEYCLNAAVGVRIGSGSVVQIGVDAAVLGGVALPSAAFCGMSCIDLLSFLVRYSYCTQQGACVFCWMVRHSIGASLVLPCRAIQFA